MKLISVSILFVQLISFKLSAQKNILDSVNYSSRKKNSIAIAIDYIYNLSSNKTKTTWTGLYGLYQNSNPDERDTVYSITYSYVDGSSFGVDIKYCKNISKRVIFDFGLGFKNKTQKLQYSQYLDNNAFKADKTHEMQTLNIIYLPLRMNFVFNRLLVSFGNNLNLTLFERNIWYYSDSSTKNKAYNNRSLNLTFQETIAYQLIKNKGLYIQLSFEQSERFYKKNGYNNWFMLGASYRF